MNSVMCKKNKKNVDNKKKVTMNKQLNDELSKST